MSRSRIIIDGFRDGRWARVYQRRYGRQAVGFWHARVTAQSGAVRWRGRFATQDDALAWAGECAMGYSLGDTARMVGIPIHDMVQAWKDGAIHTVDHPDIIIVPDEERERIRRVLETRLVTP